MPRAPGAPQSGCGYLNRNAQGLARRNRATPLAQLSLVLTSWSASGTFSPCRAKYGWSAMRGRVTLPRPLAHMARRLEFEYSTRLASHRQVAAVDRHLDAGDVGGLVGGEEQV